MRREHHSESKVRDDISGRYVFTYDAAQHTYRYHIIDWTQCAACGALLESGSKYEDRAEAHDFDENGECTVCNYVQASHTLHDWTEPGESESACYYLFLDDETHQKNVEYLLKCRVCGATTYTEGLPVNELHAFVDGVCACGYREDGGFGEPSEVCSICTPMPAPHRSEATRRRTSTKPTIVGNWTASSWRYIAAIAARISAAGTTTPPDARSRKSMPSRPKRQRARSAIAATRSSARIQA